ncbi:MULTISPECIES: CAP domain-containing protein [unclassified Agarivorans]|uniref:CAP domain-containing protein n=1 Tax=unclassified Agarivorans TaxID=2636026 RepID=UPI0010F124F3|nr:MULTISPECIES: CAP domain-containing protein [unclassified Agarivorans]MDO6683904.1 CAP domain-containing protein [Agarivorans sp. 3_MG-2023]MDO6714363.1 CAP domain-containing protein [Agarivorans sp. 2_MG-2023]GDY25055.1 hypothetical protein AHAT_09450 [Agarivorans sp. Toyoura001]
MSFFKFLLLLLGLSGPADPVEPTDPGGQDPSEPTNPVDPSDPVDPIDPEDPVLPTDPVDPVEPTDPVDPVDPIEPSDPVEDTIQARMLEAVNEARSVGRNCGGTYYPAVEPLSSNLSLQLAAEEHSTNMANYNFFSHTGLDGSSPSSRARGQGYNSSYVGENIAAGNRTLDDAMSSWLKSSGHCSNIMSANYTELGAGMSENSSSTYGQYWTQVFGAQY